MLWLPSIWRASRHANTHLHGDYRRYEEDGNTQRYMCNACDGTGQNKHFKPDWQAFHLACVDDKPVQSVIDTMHMLLDSGADVVIFSGRSDEVEFETIHWLKRNTHLGDCYCIENGVLQMRAQGDFTPDDELKQRWYDAMLPSDEERLVAVFDDRNKVVEMWRRNGVACFHVAPGNF